MLDQSCKEKLLAIFKKRDPLEADSFFNELNIEGSLGRIWDSSTGEALNPLKRLQVYESLLKEIQVWNEEIYSFLHKGTPFYFCGIHSFDIGNYNQAIFYFDAAFSEDIKNKPERDAFQWNNSAAYAFYHLNDQYGNEIVQVVVKNIRRILNPLMQEFGSELTVVFDVNHLIKRFIEKKIKETEYRSIIPSLYIFVLDYERKSLQLKIRSDLGGTIEPFITHLLRGCLIFESLLKLTYSSHSPSSLAEILNDAYIKDENELNYCKNPKTANKDLIGYTAGVRKTLPDITTHLLPYLEKNAYASDQWITLSYALRNVTAHNLSWPDKFNLENYEKLYKSVLFAIFYLIHKKF